MARPQSSCEKRGHGAEVLGLSQGADGALLSWGVWGWMVAARSVPVEKAASVLAGIEAS